MGKTLILEIKGKIQSKVAIAETFRSAYRVLDRLSDARVSTLNVIYGEDFEVPSELMGEFQHAAREALAYKDAISFGRGVSTTVIGLDQIGDPQTKAMAIRLHRS
ncbi:MAG: hypothetical protein ABI333_13265 [bacterium]